MTQLNGHAPIKVKNCKVSGGTLRLVEMGGGAAGVRMPANVAHTRCACLPPFARCDACDAVCCAQPSSFELDLDTSSFGEYTRGGIVVQSKEHKTLAFKTLAQVGGWVGEGL